MGSNRMNLKRVTTRLLIIKMIIYWERLMKNYRLINKSLIRKYLRIECLL